MRAGDEMGSRCGGAKRVLTVFYGCVSFSTAIHILGGSSLFTLRIL